MRRRLNIFISITLSTLAIQAQTSLTAYQPGINQEGIVYFLPKTGIRVEVDVDKATYTPGDFCQYAERYLRIRGVAQEPSESYRILSVRQSAIAVADTAKRYCVKFDIRTSASNVFLSDDGVLIAINGGKSDIRAEKPQPGKHIKAQAPTLTPQQYLSEEILAAGSKAKMAELTALDIFEIRESRNQLTRGQADFMPKDGEQLRLMLARLDEQDWAMTSLFAGITLHDTLHYVFDIVPDSTIRDRILFRFSEKLGMVDADDLAGTPYYINIEDLHTLPPAEESKKKNKPQPGLYVNVPGQLRSTITDMKRKAILAADYPAGQFGQTELLSGALFNKRYTTHLWLNPLSGAVERLEADQPK